MTFRNIQYLVYLIFSNLLNSLMLVLLKCDNLSRVTQTLVFCKDFTGNLLVAPQLDEISGTEGDYRVRSRLYKWEDSCVM